MLSAHPPRDTAIYKPLCIEDGKTVTVMAELDGWVQLDDGYFMELRFLDPDGDHSVTYATVKTSGVLNQLRVHSGILNDEVFLKLSSGRGCRSRPIPMNGHPCLLPAPAGEHSSQEK